MTYFSFLCMEGRGDVVGVHVSPQKPRRRSLIQVLRDRREQHRGDNFITIIHFQMLLFSINHDMKPPQRDFDIDLLIERSPRKGIKTIPLTPSEFNKWLIRHHKTFHKHKHTHTHTHTEPCVPDWTFEADLSSYWRFPRISLNSKNITSVCVCDSLI